MKPWAFAMLRGAVLLLAILVLAWVSPSLIDPATLVDRMLAETHRTPPEQMQEYAQDIIWLARLALVTTGGVAGAGFIVWGLIALLRRPSGPGQATAAASRLAWVVSLVAAAAAAYLASQGALHSEPGLVDPAFAERFALAAAGAVAMLHWLVSLPGTERALRPAVPLGALLIWVRR
jgi:hypothetical protein